MTSRRRKKPPDPPSASLLSLSCCNHALSSDPIHPYPCNLSPSLGLDYRGKYAAVSRPLPSRSRTEEYTVFRSSSIPSIWVTTTSAVGYRSAAVSCSSAWQRSLGCSSSGFCLMFKVRKARFLHTKMSQRLLSDRSGKSFGCDYPASTSGAVRSFYSLSSWVPLLPEIAVFILWGRACLCLDWGFLFKVSFSCFAPLFGRCSCRHGVSWVFHVSLGLAVLHIYSTSPSLSVLYWGIFGSVCFGSARDYDGLTAFVSFELLFPLIFLTTSWLRLPWLWVKLWTWMNLVEAKLIVTYFLLAISFTDFALCPLLSCAQSTPLIMFGCVDKVHGSHPSTTKLCSWGHVYCTVPHGSLDSIYLYLIETCPHMPRPSMSLMRFVTVHYEACLVYSDNRAHPSLLLSLLPVILHAQIRDFQCLEDNTVNFLVGCLIPLAVSCNYCFDGIVEQHLSVFVAHFFWLIRVVLCSLRPTHYGNFFNSMMKPWVLNSELEIDFPLHWMLPSVLLSLCLVALYAQNHVTAYSRWHLNSFQTVRDEVKGLYPLVYDDYSTEAFLILSLLPSSPNLLALCIQCVWPLGLLQMFWQVTQDLLARPFCAVFIIFLRPEYHAKGEVVKLRMMRTHTLELPVNKLYMSMVVQCFGIQCWLNVIVEWIFECFQLAQDISVNWSCKCSFAWKRLCAYCYWITIHPLSWTLWLGMYCSPMPVLDYINCTTDYTVSVHYGCVLVIVVSCNQYFVSILEQHIRVLGPCYKALDQHLRMLGPVFARFYYSYYNDALKWNDLFLRSEI